MNTTRALTLFLAMALVGFVLLALSTPAVRAANSVIVRVSVTGKTSDPCGDTWANACGLQYALTNTIAGSELWVAAGTYLPTGITRTATFQPRDDVALYGGFAMTETLRRERNITMNITILSGDIGMPGDSSDNAYHVVTGSGVTNTAVLDGFTVTGGRANSVEYSHYSDYYGGGIYNSAGSPSLSNVTFINNAATYSGGGMYNDRSSPTLTNVSFISNTAASGGGMYNGYASSPRLTNVSFISNTASTYGGGGIHNYEHSNPSLTNVTFSGNFSPDRGGGMENDWNSSPTLNYVTFSGNSAFNEGGMSNRNNSAPTLTNVTFISNTASNFAGGMGNFYSSPTLSNVTFSGNSATNGGGMVNSYSNPTMTNITFSSNSANDDGGGMYNSISSSPTVTNVTFSSNSAAQFGGGMNNGASSSPTLTNVTFSGNSGRFGGGLYNRSNSNPNIRNAILWGNTALSGTQIYNLTSDTFIPSIPIVSDSVVQGGYAGGTHIITSDPLLGALGNYGGSTQTIPLLRGSSAIDAGDDAHCPETDQRGVPRPQGAHCDIGAYESQGFTLIDLPLLSK